MSKILVAYFSASGVTARAAQAIAEGKMDGVVLGRASLADPDFPRKVAMGCPQEIRPCIGCNQGCIGALKIGRRTGCAVNPQAAREATFGTVPLRRQPGPHRHPVGEERPAGGQPDTRRGPRL